jgi:DNA-binding transcriptional regulator LsrR (DeoR family)
VVTSRTSLAAVAGLVADGVTTRGIAARLGLPPDLAEAMVGELDRLGVVEITASGVPRTACGTCSPAPTCAGCPLADGHEVVSRADR